MKIHLALANPTQFEILLQLASADEAALRHALRPHEHGAVFRRSQVELRFISTDGHATGDKRLYVLQDVRSSLDRALDLLTCFEVGEMLSVHKDGGLSNATLPPAVMAALGNLVQSEAFLQFLNIYQFVGIRFLAARYQPLLKAALDAVEKSAHGVFETKGVIQELASVGMHRGLLPLMTPPDLSPCPEVDWQDEAVAALLKTEKDATGDPETGHISTQIQLAKQFLDEFNKRPLPLEDRGHEPQRLELWLRGLLPDVGAAADAADRNNFSSTARFEDVAEGFEAWARDRAWLYWRVADRKDCVIQWKTQGDFNQALLARDQRERHSDLPVTGRLAIVDFYYLSKLLRAEVSPDGIVSYRAHSWLELVGLRARLRGDRKRQIEIEHIEEILRSVFSLACELVQNGAELRLADWEKRHSKAKPHVMRGENAAWRAVLDAELEEVGRQRQLRRYESPTGSQCAGTPMPKGWSRRLIACDVERDLVGLSLSGGGIRSATFNLGVLEGLQELDLLRRVDYLSTVSGGGFIGGWLVGNVRRSRYWLGNQASWKESITHLRNYSKYLAPRSGLLSMDSWSLGTLWLRNTMLIQLTVFAWMLCCFAGVYGLRLTYWSAVTQSSDWNGFQNPAALLGYLCGLAVTGIIGWSLSAARNQGPSTKKLLIFGIGVAWLGAAICSARLVAVIRSWHPPMGMEELAYSKILLAGAVEWRPILIASYIGLVVVTSCSLYASARDRKPNERKNRFLDTTVGIGLISMLVSSLSTLVFHLCLCVYVYVGLTLVFAHANWRRAGQVAEFVFGPAAVLVSYGLAILLLLGFIARRSNELQREWWTRYGAWISAAALLGLSLSGIVMGTPWLIHCVEQHSAGGHSKVKWGAIITWLAGTVSGLFAGKSSRTSENSASKSLPLDWVARIGGFLFLIGAMMGMSFVLWTFFRAVSDVRGMGPTSTVAAIRGYPVYLTICLLAVLGLIFSYCFEINIFSLNQLYRNRLVRAYLGATRWRVGMRHPDRFTNFDFDDELQLHEMRSLPAVTNRFGGDEYRGPFPIFNCSLNLGGSHDLLYQSRHSASFSMTPLYCGASLPSIGYAPTHHFNEGIRLGHAVAVSGAAASPNMGYNTSPLVAFLLSMFNVRLGWWIPNPGREKWNSKGLTFSGKYLGADLIGGANERSDFLNVSDGGHFENLAIYEMIRRRCRLIIVGDAECDEVLHFGGLANAIRLCATDFGASVEIDVSSIRHQGNADSLQHGAVGSIKYSDGSIGKIIYLKASITGDEDTTVAQYRDANPTFPHQATANQFFSEEQFESYRRLGRHVVQETFRGTTMSEDLVAVAERMADTLVSRSSSLDSFVAQAKQLDILWERLRGLSTHYSKDFLRELMGLSFSDSDALDNHVIGIGLELLQFMENVFNDLRLDDFWEHADNRGWAMLFMNWSRSRKLRRIWRENHQTFGIRFEYFCDRRLGLWVEKPVTRV